MKAVVRDEGSVDYEDIQDNIDSEVDGKVEYNSVPIRKRQVKEKLDQREFKDDEVITEAKYNENKKKGGVKATPSDSSDFSPRENDRVLSTTHYISPYANNLLSIIQSNQFKFSNIGVKERIITSKSNAMLLIINSIDEEFDILFKDRYEDILKINQLACEINAASGKVTIIQPSLKINMSEEEMVKVYTLIPSSIQTKTKAYSEGFNLLESTIVEFKIYLYIVNSKDNMYDSSRKFCKERIDKFINALDIFINDSCHANIEDDNATIRRAFKMQLGNILSSTKTNNVFKDITDHFRKLDVPGLGTINERFTLTPFEVIDEKKDKKIKKYSKNSNGIFKTKTERKSRNIKNKEVTD